MYNLDGMTESMMAVIANDLNSCRYLVNIYDEPLKIVARKEDRITAVLPENASDFCKTRKN